MPGGQFGGWGANQEILRILGFEIDLGMTRARAGIRLLTSAATSFGNEEVTEITVHELGVVSRVDGVPVDLPISIVSGEIEHGKANKGRQPGQRLAQSGFFLI